MASFPFHGQLFDRAEHDGLPLAGGLYRQFGEQRFHNVHVGAVTSVVDSGLIISTARGETLTITITPETRFPYGSDVELGDRVVIFGEEANKAIEADGLRRIHPMERQRIPGATRPMRPLFFRYNGSR